MARNEQRIMVSMLKKTQNWVVIRRYLPNIFFNGEVMQDGFFDRISGVQDYFFLTRKKRLIPAE
jgi:hypothetical protein